MGKAHRREAAAAASRTFFERASIREIQLLMPAAAAEQAYEAHVKALREAATTTTAAHAQTPRKPEVVDLDEGARAFWLGNSKDPKKLILYFPGGGYCMPALPGHFSLVQKQLDDISSSSSASGSRGGGGHDDDVGVLFLEYDLAPKSLWPKPLAQAAALLRYALEDLRFDPADIVLQGDSAGAHLAMALLSHLARGHPEVDRLDMHGGRFSGALFLSPWSGFGTDYASYRENTRFDVVSAQALGKWRDNFLGEEDTDTDTDVYSEPATAPEGWWAKVPVDSVFVGAGAREVLRDPILELYQAMERDMGSKSVQLSLVEDEFHVEPITDFGIGVAPGDQYASMTQWLGRTLSTG